MTATTTRRKQQQEMIRRAFQAEEERKRIGREKFPMTSVPVAQLAAYEPVLHHATEDHEEGTKVEAQERMHFHGYRGSCQSLNNLNSSSAVYVPRKMSLITWFFYLIFIETAALFYSNIKSVIS